MIQLQDVRTMPEAKRLAKLAAIAGGIWLLGFILLSNALYMMHGREERLDECGRVLNAGSVIKSYPAMKVSEGREPVAAVTSITDSLQLKERVAQLNSGPSGLVIQINKLYPEELTKLIEELAAAGLSARTAEIRALSYGSDGGRLINVTLALEGDDE